MKITSPLSRWSKKWATDLIYSPSKPNLLWEMKLGSQPQGHDADLMKIKGQVCRFLGQFFSLLQLTNLIKRFAWANESNVQNWVFEEELSLSLCWGLIGHKKPIFDSVVFHMSPKCLITPITNENGHTSIIEYGLATWPGGQSQRGSSKKRPKRRKRPLIYGSGTVTKDRLKVYHAKGSPRP